MAKQPPIQTNRSTSSERTSLTKSRARKTEGPPTKPSPISSTPLKWPSTLDTYQKANILMLGGCAVSTALMPDSKPHSRPSSRKLSMMSSSLQSKLLMQGQLILTIKYTCPHCSEVHFLDFPMFSSTKIKTSRLLTMHCSINSRKVGYVRWE